MESFLGTIQPFAFPFAPLYWAYCDGSLLGVQQNTALFSLLGTSFGGNGSSNFGLPDLRGRTMFGQGAGPGRSPYTMGQTGGAENVTLNQNNLAAHTHTLMGINGNGTTASPGSNMLASATGSVTDTGDGVTVTVYAPAGAMTPMGPLSIGSAGSSLPFSILPSFQVVNMCICVSGVYPSRN